MSTSHMRRNSSNQHSVAKDDILEIRVEHRHGLLSLETFFFDGRFSAYEETHDGTGAGIFKFRKDIAAAVGFEQLDSFEVEVKDAAGKWTKVRNGAALDKALERCRPSGTLFVRVSTPTSFAWPAAIIVVLGVSAVAGFVLLRRR
eukprot:TRINITY_DN4021_c0_g1_i2.p2 TRINITY_DN4021_c0_g1~~TRINITY_DN4021_c0_g1_i2.p2  ORF type:complete len:145 (-),score=5.73 TRINITY_DN4021_c0_g1_i2:195-629(-)